MRCTAVIPATRPKIAIVGEAPGEHEALQGIPFVGTSGQELTRMLELSSIQRSECLLTNVFMDRPPQNKLESWCDKKRDVSEVYKIYLPRLQEAAPEFPWPAKYDFSPIKAGKYIHPKYLGELVRLKHELETAQPNLILALGAIACWALFGVGKIEKLRGATAHSTLAFRPDGSGIKVLPTFHPAYILRNWSDRPIVLADLEKAKREAEFPEVRRTSRKIYIPETIADLWDFFRQYLSTPTYVGTDIEAHVGREITCICFSPSPWVSLVVPFTDGPGYGNYWSNVDDEVAALKFCRHVLTAKHLYKVFQNGLFDIQYLLEFWRIAPVNFKSDTMLIHHALQPELRKDLGFLGSIYTDEAAWKLMRTRAKDELEKKEE